MKRITVFLSAVVLTAAIILLNFSMAVMGDDEKIDSIVLLGDSITYGFGLSEDEQSYGDILGSYYGAQVSNYAQNGLTTEGLLEKLEQEDIQSAVKNSSMICLSIGGNDLLHIFLEAFSELGMNVQSDEKGNMNFDTSGADTSLLDNFSTEFVQKFIMDYSSQFAPAASGAAENIRTISEKLHSLNPTALVVMQTVYQPFESRDEKRNALLKPLGTFTAMQLAVINESVKKNSPYTADINTKFSQKPYLFTNIDKMDIHPNALGHMLIAEEIAQTVGIQGDNTIFKEITDKIPHGTFSEMPSFIADELDEFSNGEFRRGTLEQYMERQAVSSETEAIESTAQEEQTQKVTDEASAAAAQSTAAQNKDSSKSSTRNTLAKIFMILGLSIILAVTTVKFIKKRKKKE